VEEAHRLKDDFLAVLSHELRTPLVPVLGYADLIARGVLKGDDATEAARSVERNARAQLRLIEDLLDVSAIMSGKMRLQMGVVNLQVVAREAGDTIRTRAQAADVGLFFELDESTPFFWGDAARLRQVVWNLVSNALKFTPSGGSITVRLTHFEDGEGHAFAKLVVADTGIGIEPDFLPHVFDRFRQAGDHMTRPAGGLGLGLAIAHHFVEMHGGTIRADSPGEDLGSTFTVILPLTVLPRE
jgi:signal transduction histidine kinase